MPVVGQTMQFGDNYLNDDHLSPEIPQTDSRGSFNSMSHRSLAVSFEVPDRTTTYVVVVRGSHCDFSCYMSVVASAAAASNDRRCINYRRAGVRLGRRPRRSAAEMCRRRMRPRTQICKNS